MTAVKCVVWDLDGTVWPEVAIERPEPTLPEPSASVLASMDLLEGRGIVNCVASRTDPSLLEQLERHPALAHRIVVWRVGWTPKSASVRSIADQLGISVDALAFVDDSAFERAEVASALPATVVLSPDEFRQRLNTEAFRPAALTDDSRHRPQRYRDHVSRFADQARAAGTHDEFLRACDIRLDIAVADAESSDRMSELIARSHRLNSTGEQWTPAALRAIVDNPEWIAVNGSLTDNYGDYGLIGAMLITRDDAESSWRLRSLTTSCRAIGRGVPTALLAWAGAAAHASAVERLLVDVVPRSENLELRVLLRSAGFVAADSSYPAPANGVVLVRPTAHPIAVPDWLTVRTPKRAAT